MAGNRMRDFALEDEPKQDRELTLGPWLLLFLSGALLVLCAVCFGAGYLIGQRGSVHLDAGKTPAVGTTTPDASAPASVAKPGASGATSSPAAVPADAGEPEEAPPAANPAAGSDVTTPPALVPAATSLPATGASHAQPQPVSGWMVQIAAVTHPEDADVLTSALRRRGYAVVQRHVAGDNLIHVQVGPFVNRADANAMAQRLLGDGYNASVQ